MFTLLLLLLAQITSPPSPVRPASGGSRPADIAFNVRMLDPGFSENDGDADRDVITAGKTGLFLSENLTKAPPAKRK